MGMTLEQIAERKTYWDSYETQQQKKFLKSFEACAPNSLLVASESAAHWNRMYRELLEELTGAPRPGVVSEPAKTQTLHTSKKQLIQGMS